MRLYVRDAKVQRLCIAAAVSAAMHLAILLSVSRGAAGDNPFAEQGNSAPLIARLGVLEPQPPAPPEASSVKSLVIAADEPLATEPANPALKDTAASIKNPGEIYYFKASELERRPHPLERIEIPVPESAAALSGSVMLRLRISESGQVDDASVVMSTGITEFEEAALEVFTQARFRPGYRAKLPVRSEMLIEVTLQPPPSATEQPQIDKTTPIRQQ